MNFEEGLSIELEDRIETVQIGEVRRGLSLEFGPAGLEVVEEPRASSPYTLLAILSVSIFGLLT